jgi:hypothetical protein
VRASGLEQCVDTNASGSAIERSTCVSAAKLTIASGAAASIALETATGSSIAPRRKRKLGCSAKSWKFSSRPA